MPEPHPESAVFEQPDPSMLAQALGIPVFQSPWFVPRYIAGDWGPWRIAHSAVGLDRGYYSGPCVVSGSAVLMRRNLQSGWDTWMSMSPFEIESQELACRHAFGHTVVMGLGMGWVAANIALNPNVTKVTVIERDPDVLALFHQCAVLDDLPEEVARKIELVQADALQWIPGDQGVDFLYADIWLALAEPQALADVQTMQSHVHASQIYFWGQELVLAQMAKPSLVGTPLWGDALTEAVKLTQLPLLTEVGGDFANWIARIWTLRNPG